MKAREREAIEQGTLEARAFVNFDADTGAITQVWWCQIPPEVSGAVAVFDNVNWSVAIPDYRVDLQSIRTVEGDHDHCELVLKTKMDA